MAKITLHETLVRALVAERPEVQTTGFFRALPACGNYMRHILKEDREWRRSVAFVPDAYKIDHEGLHVILFEIVVTSDLDDEKLAKIEELGWALDQDGYDIGVIRIDKHGRELLDPFGDGLRALDPTPEINAEIAALQGVG